MAADDSSEFWTPQTPVPDRVCRICRERKPITEFGKKTNGRKRGSQRFYNTMCKECRNRLLREAAKENPDRDFAYHIAKKYHITLEDYQGMVAAQNGLCAICGLHCNKFNRLSVDHCHKTNEIRGLLCDKCNNGLGKFDDSIDRLKAAIAYLERFSRLGPCPLRQNIALPE